MRTSIYLAATSAFFLSTQFSAAQTATDKTDALFEALSLQDVIQIMREEGEAYGVTLADDFFPGRSKEQWTPIISDIYIAETMLDEVSTAFTAALEGDDIDAMLNFFNTDVGGQVIELEISARRAMLDEEIELMAEENAALAMQEKSDRYELVKEFVEANDLIETNVVGALNSNFAFYTGLLDGGGFGDDLSEDQILADVWSQETDIRQSTTEWAYSFLLLAYQPLSDDELEAYTAFSQTEAGKQLNNALFDAFDGMLERISRDLGLATSQFMMQQEL